MTVTIPRRRAPAPRSWGTAATKRAAAGVLCAALLAAPGCNFNRMVADQMATSLADSQAAFKREESPRQAREAAPGMLAMLDGFIVSSPENPTLLLAGAEMNASAGFAFFEVEDEDWARATYRKARDYGLRALATEDAELAHVLRTGTLAALEPRLAEVEADDDRIPGLFWSAFAWGSLINVSKSDMDAVAELPKVLAVIERLVKVAPDFNYAGPHLFLAVYYTSRGPAIGGNLELGKQHFDQVFARTKNRMLAAYVLYAENYCVTLGGKDPVAGRAQFEEALTYVLDAPDDLWPEERLASNMAKGWAEELMDEVDDLFLEPYDGDDDE